MPTIDKQCSIEQAFNFQRDAQEKIGHVSALKIAGKAFDADLTLKNPEDDADVKAVGSISAFMWEGGMVQPQSYTFNISITNKNNLATLLHSDMKSIQVELTFVIWDYDPEQKAYFKSVHSNDTALKALIQIEGSERILYLGDEPGYEVEQPQNYQVVLGIVPEDEAQEVHIALASDKKLVKQFGITRG